MRALPRPLDRVCACSRASERALPPTLEDFRILPLLAVFFRMLLFQLLLTAMAVTIASAAPPEVGQTTKVSACQLPAASDVSLMVWITTLKQYP